MRIHRKLFPNGTDCSDYCSGDPFADFYYPFQYPPPPPPELRSALGGGGGGGDGVSPSIIVLFVLLSSLLLLLLYYIVVAKSCFGLCDWARSQSSSGGDDGDGTSAAAERHHHPIWLIATPGLHQSVINSIAVARYRRSDGLIDGTDCSVCLSEFRDGDSVRLLPKCSHAFHVACIDAWLRSHTNCPLCRAGIVVAAAADPAPAETSEAVAGSGGSGEIAASDENDDVVRAVALGRSVSMDRGAVKVGQKREEKLSRMVRVKKRSLSCGGIRFLSARHSDGDSILPL